MSDISDPADDENAPTEEQLDEARNKGEALRQAAQKLGLYMQGFRLGTVDDDGGGQRLVVIADFLPGEVAFSDRIQRPEVAAVDETFRDIRSDLEAGEVADYRQKLIDEGLAVEPEEDT